MLALRSSVTKAAKTSVSRTAKRGVGRSSVAKRRGVQAYASAPGAFRVEKDTFGDINVPAERYWGAQTQRYGEK